MRREWRRAVAAAQRMPAETWWTSWSIVAGVTDHPRDLPDMITSSRIGLRNRVAWAREDGCWWKSTITCAWAGIAVLDGDEAIAASTAEAQRVEAVAGWPTGRTIGLVLYGLTASASPLVDPGGVRRVLACGRAWAAPGQVEVADPVDRTGISDALWTAISTAWDRRLDNDVVAVLATGRGWGSLRYRVGPVSERGKNRFSCAFI